MDLSQITIDSVYDKSRVEPPIELSAESGLNILISIREMRINKKIQLILLILSKFFFTLDRIHSLI